MATSQKQFKRMALIDEEELKRLRAKQITQYDPNIRSIVDKEEEKMAVLLDKDMPAPEKLARLEILSTHANNAKRNYGMLTSSSVPIRTESSAATQGAEAVSGVDKVANEEAESKEAAAEGISPLVNVFSSLPAGKSRHQISRLQAKIAKNDNVVNVNETGEFVYHGKAIPKSNLESLVHWLYTPKSKVNPAGSVSFLNALSEIGVRDRDVSNPVAKHAITQSAVITPVHRVKKQSPRSSNPPPGSLSFSASPASIKKQSGHGLIQPPGKRPHVLFVYDRRK